jgi:hypothetical protein
MKERRSFHSTIFLASCGVFALMISMAQLGWAQVEMRQPGRNSHP